MHPHTFKVKQLHTWGYC